MKKWRHFSKSICFEADAGSHYSAGSRKSWMSYAKTPNARFSVSGAEPQQRVANPPSRHFPSLHVRSVWFLRTAGCFEFNPPILSEELARSDP